MGLTKANREILGERKREKSVHGEASHIHSDTTHNVPLKPEYSHFWMILVNTGSSKYVRLNK